MNDNEIRIAIAQACGWRMDVLRGRTVWRTIVWYPQRQSAPVCTDKCPDYLNDLNAMHEAEKTLSAHEWSKFNSKLCDICRQEGAEPDSIDDLLEAIHATARQRAEAFLKVKGLWRDTAQKDTPNEN